MPSVQKHDTSGGGRRGRGARVATSLSEINVVPLVDVMLVLLIIFMVTAPMMQQGLQVNLPQARRATPVTAQPLYVTVPADFGRTGMVQLDRDMVRLEILQERLRQQFLTREDKSVFIRSDASVTIGEFMTVTDKLKEAGVERLGFMTQPPTR
jgi:biopolymer transport protein TolR